MHSLRNVLKSSRSTQLVKLIKCNTSNKQINSIKLCKYSTVYSEKFSKRHIGSDDAAIEAMLKSLNLKVKTKYIENVNFSFYYN